MKRLTCHCGAIEAEINITDKLEKVLRCNCSICKRKGAVMSIVKNEDFKIIKGKDKLSLYQFHTKVAKHYFCSICGIYTHHHPRINPALTGFNLGCLENIDTLKINDDNINIIKWNDFEPSSMYIHDWVPDETPKIAIISVSYTHLRAHET